MKKMIIYFLCIIVIYPFILSSAEKDDVLRETLIRTFEIKSDKDRLTTYDAIAKKVKSDNTAKNKPVSADGWSVDLTTDPIDDSKKIIFSKYADEKIGGYSKPLLVLRFSNGETEAYISWSKILDYNEDENVAVTLRFDKDEAINETWTLSSSRDASFSGEPVALVRSILSHNTLIARTAGVGMTLTTQFDLRGLKPLVEKYDKELNWINPKIEDNDSENGDGTSKSNTESEDSTRIE